VARGGAPVIGIETEFIKDGLVAELGFVTINLPGTGNDGPL